jgi:hypothetical protein
MNKHLRPDFERLIKLTVSALLAISAVSCENKTTVSTEPQAQRAIFPPFMVEQGSDSDSSYISFRGIRYGADSLEILCTSWTIVEYGPYLVRRDSLNAVTFLLAQLHTTSPTVTWKKLEFSEWITASEFAALQQLSFTNSRDTITITVTHALTR